MKPGNRLNFPFVNFRLRAHPHQNQSVTHGAIHVNLCVTYAKTQIYIHELFVEFIINQQRYGLATFIILCLR